MAIESLEQTDKVGYWLLRKGIVDMITLEKALQIKKNDKAKRNLAQILVQDFKYDHDIIFEEVAAVYRFDIYSPDKYPLTESEIEKIRDLLNKTSDDVRNLCVEAKIIPIKFDPHQKDKIIIAAIDPTNRLTHQYLRVLVLESMK